MNKQLPEIIRSVGFDFRWDERKIWELKLPTEEMPTRELAWHFDVPFLWSKPDGYYDLSPIEVMNNPEKYLEEFQRTMDANTNFPIDIMYWRKRWVILDGLHRLMKQHIESKQLVLVRKVPKSAIPVIERAQDETLQHAD